MGPEIEKYAETWKAKKLRFALGSKLHMGRTFLHASEQLLSSTICEHKVLTLKSTSFSPPPF